MLLKLNATACLAACLSAFVSFCVSSLIMPVVPPSRNVQLHKESHDECHLNRGDKFFILVMVYDEIDIPQRDFFMSGQATLVVFLVSFFLQA